MDLAEELEKMHLESLKYAKEAKELERISKAIVSKKTLQSDWTLQPKKIFQPIQKMEFKDVPKNEISSKKEKKAKNEISPKKEQKEREYVVIKRDLNKARKENFDYFWKGRKSRSFVPQMKLNSSNEAKFTNL
ncbi:hypothetical protein ACS0TY_010920 [Phlomoides rotata]